MILNLLFIFFSSVLLLSSVMIITVQNSVYSVVFLVLSFVSASGILFLIECEFFALLFIIVYVGAIAVLFLFVVMMLDVKISTTSYDRLRYFPIGLLIGIFLLIQIITTISVLFKPFYSNSVFMNQYQDWYNKLDSLTEIEALGQILYTHYVLQFLIAGLILTLAVIGAVILTINLGEKASQSQVITKQLSRRQQNVLNY